MGRPVPTPCTGWRGDWRAQGRTLFVASSSYGYVQQTVPDASISPTRRAVDHKLLEPTLTHRPDAYTSQSLAVVVARIPPGAREYPAPGRCPRMLPGTETVEASGAHVGCES